MKNNIYVEYLAVRNALLPYRNCLTHATNTTDTKNILGKAKQFYSKLLNKKLILTSPTSDYLTHLAPNCSQSQLFTQKVHNEPEIKLKEFNFKFLHGILPCNVNLKKWKLKSNDVCDVCERSQTIEHLLFSCKYVQPLWKKVSQLLNINVTFQTLLGVDNVFIYNHVFTLICFIIYKDWLLHSLGHKNRNIILNTNFYKYEVLLRLSIYRKCNLLSQETLYKLEEIANCF